MHRVDTPDVAVDLHGSGKDGYKDGVAPGASSTSTDQAVFNAFQEELAGVVEGSGETLVKTDYTQLLKAITFRQNLNALLNWALGTPAGAIDTESVASDDIDGGQEVVIMGADTNGQRSVDHGLTWASVTGQSQATESVAYGNSQYVACGSGAVNIQSSATGVTWISENTGTGSGRDVVWDETIGLWCVVGDDTGSWIVTSPDGLAWTVRSAVGSSVLNGVASNGTVFVAVGEGGTIETSVDGINWIARTAAGSYVGGFNAVVWTGSMFVAVGDATASDGEVQTSVDGITWVQSTIVGGGNLFGVWNVGGVIVTYGNFIYLNHDNCTGDWLRPPRLGHPGGNNNTITGIAYSGGMAVCCDAGSDNIYTSHLFGTLAPV